MLAPQITVAHPCGVVYDDKSTDQEDYMGDYHLFAGWDDTPCGGVLDLKVSFFDFFDKRAIEAVERYLRKGDVLDCDWAHLVDTSGGDMRRVAAWRRQPDAFWERHDHTFVIEEGKA